jgi:ATPase subunit of ABC transporter with duplicated ATPase domains
LQPKAQKVAPRLRDGRTAMRAVTCESLELTGLMAAFDTEVFFGVLGANGSGKSHFLRLLGGDESVALQRGLPARCPGRARPVRADASAPRVGRPYLAGLQEALREFTGTVVAVTHDRWFARSFDRYLLFEVGKPVNVRDDVASSA